MYRLALSVQRLDGVAEAQDHDVVQQGAVQLDVQHPVGADEVVDCSEGLPPGVFPGGIPVVDAVEEEDVVAALIFVPGKALRFIQQISGPTDAAADLVNDIWGLKYDRKVADLIAQYRVPCCLMHNRQQPEYEHFLEDVCRDLSESVEIARAAGIGDDQIILDPGVGFGKTYAHNLMVIRHLDRLVELGYPVLLAASRKSVIGLTLDLPADQRVEGTLVTTVLGVEKGAAFVRVHDVKENLRAIRMTQAILRAGREG